MFKDSLFKKIEDKTSINKDTIMKLANKIQNNDLKDEKCLNDLIDDLSSLTGKEVSKEKKEKIISMIKNDNIPQNVDNML